MRFGILEIISFRINPLTVSHSLPAVWDSSEIVGQESHVSYCISRLFETVRLRIPLICCGIHQFVPRLTAIGARTIRTSRHDEELKAVGARSKAKGKRGEREVVALAKAAGLEAARTWHLAQSPDASERVRDVQIGDDSYQVQISKNGFERIYHEVAGVRGFIFRRDRGEWLIALRLTDYLDLLRGLR